MRRSLTNTMPIEAVPRSASCSRRSRATSSAWRRRSVMSSTVQTVPCRRLAGAAPRRIPQACGAGRARSSAPGEVAEVARIAAQLGKRPRALVIGEAAVDVERHREEFLARGLQGGRIGRLAAAVVIRGKVGQAFLRFVRAQHGEELGLQALVVAVAQTVEQRRALGVLRYALDLRLRQFPHPVLQPLDVALRAALALLALAAFHGLARVPAGRVPWSPP